MGERLESGSAVFEKYFSSQLQQAFGNIERTLKLKKRYHRANIVPHLTSRRDAGILEIGPGYGEFLDLLLTCGYQDLHVVDISPEVSAYIREQYPQVDNTCTDHVHEFLKEHQDTYQHVIMMDVIEHIPRGVCVELLEAIRAALIPGGSLIVQTVNMATPFSCNTFYSDFTHCSGFTDVSMRQLLCSVGFDDVHVYGYRFPAGVVGGIRSVLRWPLLKAWWLGAMLNGIVRLRVLEPELVAVARLA